MSRRFQPVLLGALLVVVGCGSSEPKPEGGHGGHSHAHGAHDQGGHAHTAKSITQDPVCRMEVSSASLSAEEAGRRFPFCSEQCLAQFKSEPRRYAQAAFDAQCSCNTDMPDCDCGHCKGAYEPCDCGG